MNKLLSANFARLKKDRGFLGGTAAMFLLGILMVGASFLAQEKTGTITFADNLLMRYTVFIGIAAAAFISLFVGTEYSDGTIRNKLVVGHKRGSIYLANLVTCMAASLLMCLAYIAVVLLSGFSLFAGFEADPKIILWFVADSLVMVTAFSSIFVLLGMLNQNKAQSAVISLVGVMAFLLLASYLKSRLDAPEFYDGYVFTDSLGNSMPEQIPNELYLRGMERTVYEFFLDFLPTGQASQIVDMSGTHLWRMPLYSLLIVFVSTAAGLFFFGKKDLK